MKNIAMVIDWACGQAELNQQGKELTSKAADEYKAIQAVVYASREAVKLLHDGETTMAAVCLEDALRALDGKENK